MKVLKTFYSFFWKYKIYFIFSFITAFIGVLFSSLLPFIYRYLIDNFSGMTRQTFFLVVGVYAAARMGGNLFSNLSYYTGDKASIPAARDARIKVFSYLQNLDFAFHTTKKSGEFISKIRRGDGAFFDIESLINRELIDDLFNLFVVGAALSFVDIKIVYTLVAALLLIVLVSFVLVKKNMSTREAYNKEEDNLSHLIADNLINYETVKYFAKEKREIFSLKEAFKEWQRTLWNFALTFRQMHIAVTSVSTIAIAIILAMAASDVMNGSATAGDFVLVVSFAVQVFPSFERLVFKIRRLAKSYTDIKDYFAILDFPLVVKDPEQPLKFEYEKGAIEFKNLSFAYANGQDALKNISITMPAGCSTALVGRSGSGKTTMMKLLMRVYDPVEGQVLVDGFDISKIKKEDLRRNIGIVPQEPILFNNTIGYNIGYPLENASKEEIEAAAKLANLHDFIITLEKGYDTVVGERGVKLSGGQKQRLAIARVFLLNPKIIIFDEATSHLDSESERLIQDSMEKLAQGKTFIAIAHRLSTVMKADKIVVLDNGKIIEEGTHEELLSQNSGIYKRLWELQTNHEILENGY